MIQENKKTKKQSCLICFNDIDKDMFNLPCSCDICEECLFQWIATKNYETVSSNRTIFTCANHECKKEIPYDFIANKMSKKNITCINEILFRKYMNHSMDIRKCPNRICPYAGWLDTNNKCSDLVECSTCEEKWLEPSVMNYKIFYKIYLYLKNFKENFLSDLSELNVLLTSKPCAHCGIKIYKYVGCDHIVCSHCHKDFCYNCNHNHNENQLFNAYCGFKYLNTVFTIILTILCMIAKIISSFYWVRKILYGIYYFCLLNVIFGVYCYVAGVLIYFTVISCVETYSYNRRHFLVAPICFGFLMVLFGSHLYLYLSYETVWTWTNYFLLEVAIAGCIGLVILIGLGIRNCCCRNRRTYRALY
jgi:hypothetical protein